MKTRVPALLGLLAATACAPASKQIVAHDEPKADAAATVVEIDPAEHGWEVSTRYTYRVKLTTAIDLGAHKNAFDFDLLGSLQLRAVAVSTNEATLAGRIADARVVTRLAEQRGELAKLAESVREAAFSFTLAGGHVTELRVPEGLSATAANTLRAVANGLQFSRATSGAATYSIQEYDAIGRYLASYSRGDDGASWQRRKERYTASLTDGKTRTAAIPLRVLPKVIDATAEIHLSPQGRPVAVESRDEIAINGAQAPVHASTALSLSADDSPEATSAPDETVAASQATHRIAADQSYGEPPQPEALDSARIGGLTFDSAVSQLETLAKQSAPSSEPANPGGDSADPASKQQMTSEVARLFGAVVALLREQPGTVPTAVNRIASGSPASPALIGALGSASTPATQKALVDLYKRKQLDAATHDRVATALIRTPRPDKVSIDALKAILVENPFDTVGLYGLGSYSRRLRGEDQTQQADALGTYLLGRYSDATTDANRVRVLKAIGNSGYAGALPTLMSLITTGSEDVRAAAVGALQSIPDPRVDGMLADRLTVDSSTRVRVSAIHAAEVRDPNDVVARALTSVAVDAPDPQVRYHAVELIGQWLPSRPDLRTTLERVTQSDSETKIRTLAKSLL